MEAQALPLTPERRAICERTISSMTLFHLVMDRLVTCQGTSVVRMADGEGIFMRAVTPYNLDTVLTCFPGYENVEPTAQEAFVRRIGLHGITYGELERRIDLAAHATDYLAPSTTGIHGGSYDVYEYYGSHPRLAEHFFVNIWPRIPGLIDKLYDTADGVILINGNTELADEFQRRLSAATVKHLKLAGWQQTEEIFEQVARLPQQLVLCSVGMAGKYLVPKIASLGKVALDVGNSAPLWLPFR
jgi:hypothetical protein